MHKRAAVGLFFAFWAGVGVVMIAFALLDMAEEGPPLRAPVETERTRIPYELPPWTGATPVPHFAPRPKQAISEMVFLSCFMWGFLYKNGCEEQCSGNYGCSYVWPER